MKNRVKIRSFTCVKSGHEANENEDSVMWRTKRNLLVAMSDGATESSLAREWADSLVESNWKNLVVEKSIIAVSEPIPQERVASWLAPVRNKFQIEYALTEDTPWFAREKRRRGSHATFLACKVSQRGRWWASACGDTCLVLISDHDIVDSFPIRRAADFGTGPVLISSLPEGPLPVLIGYSGKLSHETDRVVLATDAIAAWLLPESAELSTARLTSVLKCVTSSEFQGLVTRERASGNLKNDDSSIVIIEAEI